MSMADIEKRFEDLMVAIKMLKDDNGIPIDIDDSDFIQAYKRFEKYAYDRLRLKAYKIAIGRKDKRIE